MAVFAGNGAKLIHLCQIDSTSFGLFIENEGDL